MLVKNPVISVVMPVYNTPVPFLREAVESILEQTIRHFEFIIVDDGSTGETKAFLDSLTDERIRLIRNPENMGCTKSLNNGLRAATGKYIARMDADDISMPGRFEVQLDYMEAHPDVVVCGSKIAHEFKDTGSSRGKIEDAESYRIRMLFVSPGPVHPTAMIRRETLVQNNIEYDENLRYAQDYGLWATLVEYGRIVTLPDKLLYFREHDDRISIKHRADQIKCDKMTQKRLLLRLLDNVTDAELDLHYLYSTGYYRDLKLTKDVRRWYRKLIRANDKKRVYNRLKFRKKIYRSWLRILTKR